MLPGPARTLKLRFRMTQRRDSFFTTCNSCRRFPYESADGGFDLVGYSPTGTRPPIETFAINDFSISFRGDFDGDGREDVESVEGRLTSLVVVPDRGMSLVSMGLGLLAVSLLDRKGWSSSRELEGS